MQPSHFVCFGLVLGGCACFEVSGLGCGCFGGFVVLVVCFFGCGL